MSDYYDQIVALVVAEAAKGVSHKKILEPLANMVASVLAGIAKEHGIDDRVLFKAQLDKMFERYSDVYNTDPTVN